MRHVGRARSSAVSLLLALSVLVTTTLGGDGLHTLQDYQTHSYYGTGWHHTDIWANANATIQSRTKAVTLKALKYFAPALRTMQ